MKTLFIGTGNVGATLAKRFKARNHEITLYNRTGKLPNGFSSEELVDDLQQAIDKSEIIVLAIPFDAIEPILTNHTGWNNKIIIDATNPIASNLKSMTIGNTSSGAERISELIPEAHVVKSFNTTGWENMENPDYGNRRLTMFYAGDDKDSKQVIGDIIVSLGFEPYDVGDLFMSRFLEAMAMVWIHPARIQGKGSNFGFSLIHRNI
jgi:predicted dinucleotide-binding enzyme